MSPEHFRAPEKVDGRSDVFSLGVVLYQLLTGKLPFKGTFVQIRSAILEDEPASPRRLSDSVPVDLETIALACLEKDPQRRYATAQAVAEDLRRYQNGEPILCRPTGNVERAVKWMYRKPAQAALVGVGTLAAVALVVLFVGQVFYGQLQAAHAELKQTKGDLEVSNGELEKTNGQLLDQRIRVERLNYIADMNLAHQAWQNDNFGLLEQYLAAHEKSDLRGFEWHYLRWLASTDGQRVGPKDPVDAVAFDPAGMRLALGVGPNVQIWGTPTTDQPGGELLQTLKGDGQEIRDIAFHSKHDWLITSDRQGTIVVWDLKKNARTDVIGGTAPFAVSPDGATLAYVRPDGAVGRWNFAKKQNVGVPIGFNVKAAMAANKAGSRSSKPGPRSFELDRGSKPDKGRMRDGNGKLEDTAIRQLAFSPDGQWLAIVGGYYKTVGLLTVQHLLLGKQLPLESAQTDDLLTSVAFSPDGQSIVAGGFDHVIRVWDAQTGKLRFRRAAHKLEVLSVAFNAGGDRIASAGWDHTIRIWNAQTGEELRQLRGNRGVVAQVLFCPDAKSLGGDHLISLNEQGELRWWNAGQEQSARVTPHTEPVHSLAFSPRGRFLASFGRNGQVLIQEVARPDQRFELAAGPTSHGLFSPDENTLFTLGGDGVLQTWPFAKGGDGINVPGVVAVAGQRMVVRVDANWLVSPPNPAPNQPLHDLLPFGKAPEIKPDVVAVDAGAERLAFAQADATIVSRRRNRETGELTEMMLTPAKGAKATVNALAFSPDGRRLAVSVTAANQDYAILLLDADSGALLHRLTGHLCSVGCLAFSPDGKRLASGSEDWTVKIWDLDVGRATLTLGGHTGRIRDLAFSPDGKLLASASEDGTVRVWPGFLEAADMRWKK
jgi:WD40 repeat protein